MSGDPLPDHIAETVAAVEDLHAKHREAATRFELVAENIAGVLGQPISPAILTLAIAGWLLAGRLRPAFSLDALEVVLTVFAAYTTLLILAGQQRQERLANTREQLTLQLALLNERKSTKIIALLEEFRRDSPAMENRDDPEAAAMSSKVDAKRVTEAIAQIEKS